MKKLIRLAAVIVSFLTINVFGFTTQRLTIPSIDSIQLDSFIYFPEGVEPKGIVLVIGGSGLTRAGFGGPSKFAKAFADNGFIGVEWNKRGLITNIEISDVLKDFSIYNTTTIDKIYADAQSVLIFMKSKYPQLPVFVLGGSEGSVTTTLLAEKDGNFITAVATFGNVIMPFIQTSSMQVSDLFLKERWQKIDLDRNNSVDSKELSEFSKTDKEFAFIDKSIFSEIDLSGNGVLSYEELATYVVDYFVNNHPDKDFWYKSSGVSTHYLDSMFRLPPLTSRSLNIVTPVFIAQGEDDWNTPVKQVYDFQIQCKALGKTNFIFKYYAGVGHAPSAQMLNDFIMYFNSFLTFKLNLLSYN